MIISWNGQFKDANEAVISVYDHGFLYGLGLFETFRTYQGKPFLLDQHLDRLHHAAKLLHMHISLQQTELIGQIEQLMQVNQLKDAYIRLTVSAGVGELGLPSDDYNCPNVLLLVKSLPHYSEEQWTKGKALQLLETKRNTPEGEYRFKSLHYMNNIIAKRELQSILPKELIGAEGLMLTQDGFLAEGIVSNLFFAKDGVIYTPSLDTGILAGVTRQFVIELAEQQRIQVCEGKFTWQQLLEADEIWTTTSITEITAITTLRSLDGLQKIVGTGSAGSMTIQLKELYQRAVLK